MLPVESPPRLLDELSEAYCNKYRLVLCSFSNYLILSILMSKLGDRADLREKLRTVFAGGVVDFVTLLSWRDEFHRARATLALHGPDVGRLVRQVTGRSQRVVEQLDPEKSSPQSTARDPIQRSALKLNYFLRCRPIILHLNDSLELAAKSKHRRTQC